MNPNHPATDAAAQRTSGYSIGIVIPTFRRSEILMTCLEHLEKQTCRDFEVVVVDDGSGDGTREALERYATTAPFPLRIFFQANTGPAGARNRGIAALEAPICLMIGDDILASPAFVETHLRFHREHPEMAAAAVGLTVWSESRQTVTPLMRWLADEGVQFANRALLAGEPVSWKHFYTSNLSVKTALLKANPFDEGFPTYGFEDIELGYRLAEQGLRMYFLADAVAEHVHPVDFMQTCRRAQRAGAGAVRLEELWPGQWNFMPPGIKGQIASLLSQPLMLGPLTAVTRSIGSVWLPKILLARVLQLHHIAGYRRALRNRPATH